MTESEYIKVTNRVNISRALEALRDVLPGDEYGVGETELTEIEKKLRAFERRLLSNFDTEDTCPKEDKPCVTRLLTQQEIDNAPDWATHYVIDLEGDPIYAKWYVPLSKPIPRNEFSKNHKIILDTAPC